MKSIRLNESDLRLMVQECVVKILSEQSNLDEMLAYHGSKVNFNQFSNDFFKTGYGACKYGNGVYVTIDKNTAGHYATGQEGNVRTPDGFVYTVQIPDNDGTNYIIWNQPIGQAVYEKIKDYWYDEYTNEYVSNITPQTTGEQIYNDIRDNMGRANFAAFADYGITGVMVPDTTKEHNLVNYVIFDANNVKILQKQTAQMNGNREYNYGNI